LDATTYQKIISNEQAIKPAGKVVPVIDSKSIVIILILCKLIKVTFVTEWGLGKMGPALLNVR